MPWAGRRVPTGPRGFPMVLMAMERESIPPCPWGLLPSARSATGHGAIATARCLSTALITMITITMFVVVVVVVVVFVVVIALSFLHI